MPWTVGGCNGFGWELDDFSASLVCSSREIALFLSLLSVFSFGFYIGPEFLCFGFARIEALPTAVSRNEVEDLC